MKVSVIIVTYNLEKFVAQAIESALMQTASFDYEIVIGEDCSTDRTRGIVMEYQQRFPDKIRLRLSETNVGGNRNFALTLRSCTGKYVAILEGDDYWTTPYKLQKQVDFLESHPECSVCFHPVRWFYEGGEKEHPNGPDDHSLWPENPKDFSTIEDLLETMFIQSGSVMFRRYLMAEYPEWLYSFRTPDWGMYVRLAHFGTIGCLQEAMSAYRKHAGGICYALDDVTIYKETIKMYDCINAQLDFRYQRIIRPLLADQYFRLAVVYDQRGDDQLARDCIAKCVAARLQNINKPTVDAVKMLVRLSFPLLYQFSKKLIKA